MSRSNLKFRQKSCGKCEEKCFSIIIWNLIRNHTAMSCNSCSINKLWRNTTQSLTLQMKHVYHSKNLCFPSSSLHTSLSQVTHPTSQHFMESWHHTVKLHFNPLSTYLRKWYVLSTGTYKYPLHSCMCRRFLFLRPKNSSL